jgi:glycosyltransferase involved in cell wall biosynthesis
VNVVHVFPYSARVSGGHSNAIHAFIRCQRLKGINAVAISPRGAATTGDTPFGFPLAEVDSLWPLEWKAISSRLGISDSDSLLNFHSVDHRFAHLMRNLRQVGIPYVVTSHGQLGVQTVGRWLKKFLYLNLVDHGPRRAAGLHLLTSVVKQQLGLVLPGYHGHTLVQGNVISPPNLDALPAATRSDFGIPPNAFVLLYLGRLDVGIKGLDLIVEAMSFLPGRRFCFVLAGPDWRDGRIRLERLADQVGAREQLQFTGPVSGDRKWQLLRLADVFISPSRREAFSVAVIEAKACGLPVVTCTRVDLALDLVTDSSALVCPMEAEALASAIMTLDADPEGRRALGCNGKAWVEANCNPYRAGERFRDFYAGILAKRSSPIYPPRPALAGS